MAFLECTLFQLLRLLPPSDLIFHPYDFDAISLGCIADMNASYGDDHNADIDITWKPWRIALSDVWN